MTDFRGYFAVQLVAFLVCLFLRVFRVMLASYTTDYPTIRSQWEQPAYHVLYYMHMATTLWYYYKHVGFAHELGYYFGEAAFAPPSVDR